METISIVIPCFRCCRSKLPLPQISINPEEMLSLSSPLHPAIRVISIIPAQTMVVLSNTSLCQFERYEFTRFETVGIIIEEERLNN